MVLAKLKYHWTRLLSKLFELAPHDRCDAFLCFLLSSARRLFEGGGYSNRHGICRPKSECVDKTERARGAMIEFAFTSCVSTSIPAKTSSSSVQVFTLRFATCATLATNTWPKTQRTFFAADASLAVSASASLSPSPKSNGEASSAFSFLMSETGQEQESL